MKRRLLSLFLAFVTILSLLPTAAFAASSEEDALGEVDIYNGDYELGYLAINGAVKKQKYTYFLYESNDGSTKESPAYCVNPNQYGVPQTVGPGESIKYLANEKASDPKVVGIISNGYPHRSLGELGLENKYQAFYATKMALWCYLIPSWDISNLKVAPGLSGDELDRGNRILAAAKDIYKRGTTYNYMLTPRMTVTADKSTAYPVTIGGQAYLQQVFTIWSETWVYDYDVSVAFSDPDSVPEGTKIVDANNKEITAVTTKYTSDGYAGTFKVLYPAGSVEGQSGNVQFSLSAPVAQYAAMYAVCQEKDQYGDLQNYICDLDNKVQLDVAAVSSYADSGEPDPDETALKIVKLEEGTEIPLEGAVFSVYDLEGKKVGSFSTGPDGTVTIPLTLEGHYTITEEIPPRYHLLPEETTQHADVEYNKTATLTFWNAPYGSLRVEKRSDTGDALSGVTIQIKHIETGETRTGQTRNGVIVFDELAPGGWEVRELAGIDGWVADTDTVQTVAVVTGQESTATIINKELPGLRITKYERGTMTLMPNVSFEIFRDAESLGIFTTDEFGQILLTNCEPGTYRAEERDTGGDGHVLDTTPQEVELKAGDGIKELVFFNDRLPGIHLIKVDSADLSQPIANARFRIEAVDGSWGPEEYTTSEDGTIDLSKLPVGAYVVTELECPGYVIDEAQRIIHLDGNETAQFVFTNSKLPSLHLTKISADGSPLAGVTYSLTRIEDGSRYMDQTTSSTGTIVWDGLQPGVYSLRETDTLSDHILDPKEYHVELFPGKDGTIVLENDKRPNLTIWKRDADSGAPIEGTVFLVKGADGHSVAEVTTGPDGSATVPNLLPAVYEVSEKSVPSPYLLDAEPQLMTLYPNRDRDVYFENHKAPSIEIIKENSITHEPLANVRFQVWYASNDTETGEYNDLGIFTTDENGRIELTGPANGLRDGWFRVKELEPPAGFSIKDSDTQEAFVPAGKGHTFRFENT
ncbi:SpaA isopeptide-forming pilin-related protein, partial [Flavonifractor plautii]|uniref:SpaA isopeptide-forming pilin-related protein n=1 Tax=Flavonifractor plautii TaxID=292800 RepID=UPI00325BC13E